MGKKTSKKKIEEQDIRIPPKCCPIISNCKAEIDWGTFEYFCNSEDWIFCEHATKIAKKYKRRPYVWKLISKLGGFPFNQTNRKDETISDLMY